MKFSTLLDSSTPYQEPVLTDVDRVRSVMTVELSRFYHSNPTLKPSKAI